jgi:hypothetical protein
LLAGAGAAGLAAAADTNGNGIAMNGSDTLFEVTNNDVFSVLRRRRQHRRLQATGRVAGRHQRQPRSGAL